MNNLKALQYWIHRNYKDIKLFIAVIVLIFFAYTSLATRADNRQALEKIDSQNQQIATQGKQIKQLSQENKVLNERSNNHVDCVARIFANYTHNFVPVSIKDLDTCTLTDGTSSNTSGGASSAQSNASGGLSAGSSSANSAPTSKSSTANIPQSGQNTSKTPENAPQDQGLIPNSIPILGRL